MKNPIPEWMQKEVAEYDLDLNPPPASIHDIGANIGAFALHYHAKWPSALIHCFEPVPSNFAELERNTQDIREIFQHEIAIRSTGGMRQIFLGDQGVTCSFHQRGRQQQTTVAVDCEPAKDLASFELVKIDTEGCEVEILHDLDLRSTRAVVVEYHSDEDAVNIGFILASKWGFSLLERKSLQPGFGVMKFARPGAGVSLPALPSPLSPLPTARPKRKVYLAVAAHYAANDLIFVQSLLALSVRTTVPLAFGFSADPSVERARNILTANFLASDCTHILFADSDIGFNAEDVARISSHEALIVGGMYPLKNMNAEVQWCGNGLDAKAESGKAESGNPELMPVKYIGTGFLCIKREAFAELLRWKAVQAYSQDFPPHRREHAFFFQGVVNERFLTEDWMFCHLCGEIGLPIFADRGVVLRHAGRAEWPLPLQAGNPFNQRSEVSGQKSEPAARSPLSSLPSA